ncbi:unnamed protein product [Ambrosiozyma monospora]|uniref:Heat shock transcription factor n=1 Tax=Ambrosiozyma monospora TaxID=43982 RepID=A0A9W6Z553_AMBMO|nr:unnamed protein product [Ambrosiozyma monospora]
MKLWNMVNDSSNEKFISWLPKGDAFQVSDREGFMKNVLPKYFRHNNFASFVRQLNMYGWHKVQDVNSGSLLQEEVWQFSNPNFQKGKENLLDKIVRNKSTKDDDEEVDLVAIMNELETMRQNQKLIANDLRRVRQDNEMLWKENFMARERHKTQSQTLDKILQFLATVYGSNSSKFLENVGGSNEVFDLVSQRYPNGNNNMSGMNSMDGMGGMNGMGALQTQNGQGQGQPSDLYDYPYQPVQQNYQATSNGGNSAVPMKQPLMIANRAHYRSTSSSMTDISGTQNPQHDPSVSSVATGTSTNDFTESPIQEIRRGPETRNFNQFDNYNPQQQQQMRIRLQQQQQQRARLQQQRVLQMQVQNQFQQQQQQLQSEQQQNYNNQSNQAGPSSTTTQFTSNTPNAPIPKFPIEIRTPAYETPLTPTSELLMGTINSQLSKQQGTISQVNDWITRLHNGEEDVDVGVADDMSASTGSTSTLLGGAGVATNSNDGVQTGNQDTNPVYDDFTVDEFLNSHPTPTSNSIADLGSPNGSGGKRSAVDALGDDLSGNVSAYKKSKN